MTPTEQAADEPTLDGLSAEGRRLAARIERELFGRASRAALGRFVLLDVIGRGGMGVVYRAYDPKLDRQVAVKVLSSTDEAARARMLREAQLLARLGHPHVVAIHEVGEDRGDVFVAMELVDGGTLLQWCEAHAGTGRARVRRLLELCEQAIDGLAAAHALGIVHRDVKPANLLVGADGRLRVADFGLARAGPVPTEDGCDERSTHAASMSLTATGAAVGTPAYMPPEQLAGEVDARSDQFGLCASFFEALSGQRPYQGASQLELLEAIETGRLATVPPGTVPRSVLAVLQRGLRPRPEDRFPDMRALGRALRSARQGRRGLWSGVTVLGVIAVGGGLALSTPAPPGGDPGIRCAEQAEAAAPAWDHARRERIRQTFVATGLGYAEGAWSMTDAVLTGWRERWIEARTERCRARAQPHGADLDELDADLRCLALVDESFTSLTNALQDADASAVQRATTAARALPAPQRCREEGFERSLAGAEAEAEAEPWLEPLLAARLAHRLGHRARAEQGFTQALAALGDDADHLRAWVHCELASELHTRGDYDAVVHEALAALALAEQSDEPEAAVYAWRLLATAWARQDRVAEAELALARADSLARRPEVSEHTRARQDWAAAAVLNLLQRHEPALPRYERALVFYEARMQEHPSLASLHCDYAEALLHTAHVDLAIEHAERCRVLYERLLGSSHPLQATAWGLLAVMRSRTSSYDEALTAAARALELLEADPSFNPTQRAAVHEIRGTTLHRMGRDEEAARELERALRIRLEREGPEASPLVSTRNNLSLAYQELGRIEEAIDQLEQAIAIGARDDGRAQVTTATARLNLSLLLAEAGRDDEALAQLEQARAVADPRRPPSSSLSATYWISVSEAYARLDRLALARQTMDHALESIDRARVGDAIEGKVLAQDARLRGRMGQREQALAVARRAIAALRAAGEPGRDDLDQLQRWLAEPGRPQ